MKDINVLIADDELPARGELQYEVQAVPGAYVVGSCKNGREVMAFLKKNPSVDLLFLDIEMPVMNGLEVAKKIRALSLPLRFVFATGFSQFAVQAFELEAFDYILKPYNQDRISHIIRKVQHALEEEEKRHAGENGSTDARKFMIEGKGRSMMVHPREELVFISTEKTDKCLFYTTHGTVESKLTLREAEELLTPYGFFRTNKGFIVNLAKIKTIESQNNSTLLLTMQDYPKLRVPVSRHYIKDFKHAVYGGTCSRSAAGRKEA